MSASARRWPRIVPWLALIKVVYLATVSVAVNWWPHFDEEQAEWIDAVWFAAATAPWAGEKPSTFARHFATWDAEHYLYLSEIGYSPTARSRAFYPLWPLAVSWFSLLTGGNHLVAGMVLSNLFSLAGWAIFYHVCARRFGERVAFLGLVLLIIFPGSLFYQFIYSESLFFLLLMLLWLGLEQGRFGLAWIAAFLLPLTRAVGLFALLPLAWYWLMRRPWRWLERWQWLKVERQRHVSGRSDATTNPRWQETALLAAPLLGWAVYLGLMWFWTGNPFEGMKAQKYWGAHSISNLWDLPKFVIGFLDPTTWHGFKGSVLDRCAFLLLLYTLPVIWRLGKGMCLWTYVLGVLPAMSGTFTSFIRFESCVFPLFIALAAFFSGLKRKWPLALFATSSAILHIVLLWRFVNFRWAG
jgi:hypothetical protein